MPENPYISPDDAGGPPEKKSRPWLMLLAVFAIGAILVALLLLPTTRSVRPAARRAACSNNLKFIGMALANYEVTYHALPPAYTVDAEGKPLHSWRTLILPFIEQHELYEKIDLTKPWNDPANAEAFKTVVELYQCPQVATNDNRTNYLAVVTLDSCLRAAEPRLISEITDGASKTVVVVEVAEEQSVPWMTPEDADEKLVLNVKPNSPSAHVGGMNAVFVDGHVEFLGNDLPREQRRAMISVDGGEPFFN